MDELLPVAEPEPSVHAMGVGHAPRSHLPTSLYAVITP